MPAMALSRVAARVVESGPGGENLAPGAWQRLEALPGPRSPQGRIYPLACLIAVAVCAFTAAGNDRFTAVGQWIRRASQADLARLHAPWDPIGGRYRLRAVAVDGKTSRGARRADGTRVHLLGVAEHGGHLLDHLEVDVKHNETSHFTELLDPLDLAGAVVTCTVRANLDWLAGEKKSQYIAVVKKNQPLLHARVRALPWRQVPTGRTTRETVYAVTSLTSAHATAQDLARLVREHWSIEAHHHIRDTTFSEDTATSRTGSGPANLATIRAAIIAAIKDAGYLHVPEGRRDHTTPAETLHLHGLD